jgi:hypothetical protein
LPSFRTRAHRALSLSAPSRARRRLNLFRSPPLPAVQATRH